MSAVSILVVCLGNICRSPAGEAAIREAADRAGVDITVDSAGTGPWHVGERPHRQIRAAGQRAGLEVDGRGRQVTDRRDLVPYDLVLAMDRSNMADLRAMAPDLSERIHLFAAEDPTNPTDEVDDPYGYPDSAFDDTIVAVRSAASALIEAIGAGRLP